MDRVVNIGKSEQFELLVVLKGLRKAGITFLKFGGNLRKSIHTRRKVLRKMLIERGWRDVGDQTLMKRMALTMIT